MADRLFEIWIAITFLTRIPVPGWRKEFDPKAFDNATWAYPLVGGLVGAVGGGVYWLGLELGLPLLAAAALAIVLQIVTTGCFHEDGLADFLDGIGGGLTVERRHEIMRDSRIGSYGSAGMIAGILIRASLLTAITDGATGFVVLVMIGLVGRAAPVGLMLFIPASPTHGGKRTAVHRTPLAGYVAVAIAICVPFLALSPAMAGAVIAGGVAGGIVVGRLIRRLLDGYTGDALGACEQFSEMFGLLAIAILLGTG